MDLLKWIGGVIIILWLIGFLLKIGGALIHILLLVAVVVFVFDFLFGRK